MIESLQCPTCGNTMMGCKCVRHPTDNVDQRWVDHLKAEEDKATIARLEAHDIPRSYIGLPKDMDKTHNAEAYDAVKAWASDELADPWLYIYGGPGQGKTRLLYAALQSLVRHKHQATRTTMADMVETYLNAQFGDRELFVSKYRNTRFLIIDEVGVEKMGANSETDKAASAIYRILDYRYERKKRTLAAGNVSMIELSKRSDEWLRLAHRFKEIGRIVNMTGGDYRNKIRDAK